METTFEIQNLKCGGCANTIQKNIKQIEGVDATSIDVENNTVSITHSDEATAALAKNTLAKIGYPVLGDSNSVITQAKSFVSCAIGKMS